MNSNAMRCGLAALVALPLSTSPLVAQRSATLSQAITAALRDNPDVLTARGTLDSARSERRIAGASPNPTLMAVPNSPYQYAVSLPLDFMPSRFHRTQAASIGVDASEFDRRDMSRQVRVTVARSFYDILLAQERRTLARARVSAVTQLLAADSARFRAGDVPARNLVRSEVELARADAELARRNVDVQVARGVLQALMGVTRPDTGFVAVGSLDYRALAIPADSLGPLAVLHRDDLKAAMERVNGSRATQQLASSLVLPPPILSFVRQYTAPFESGHYYSLGLAFDLPVFNLHGGERARAAAGVENARVAQRRTAISVQRDVAAAQAEFRIQQALVERYQSGLLRRIDESLDAVRYAYSRGANSLLDVLDAVRSQEEVRSDYVGALHDYWVSVYALDAAVGTDLFGLGDGSAPTSPP